MAGVSIDNFGASFIEYLPGVTETLDDVVTLRKYSQEHKWEGDHIRFYVHVSRNIGHGNTEDGGAIASAGKQGYVPAQAYRRFYAGAVQITDGALANAATSKRAAIDVVSSELRGLMEDAAKYQEFMSYQNGTGVVGLLGTDIDGTTWGATDARLIQDGQIYEIRDADDISVLHGTVTISSVARALDTNGDFAVTSAAALPAAAVAGDFIVWPNATNRCVTGLLSMIDDAATTFQGVNTSTYPRYTSPVLDNSGTLRPLNPTLFRRMLAMLKSESGKAGPASGIKVITNNWQGIEVEELYESELRITPDSKSVGVAAPTFISSFGKIVVETSHDCPFNTMFFCNFDEIYRAVQHELDWRRDKAGGIFQRSRNSLSWGAECLEISEFFIKQRNKCGRIDDLSETVASAY